MSCSNNSNSQECKYKQNNMKYNQQFNNYCAARTINEPRDVYNEEIQDFWSYQGAHVHQAARLRADQMNGWVGCMRGNCGDSKPVCATISAIGIPEHVGIESKLRGL
jgi:hypothetical protein